MLHFLTYSKFSLKNVTKLILVLKIYESIYAKSEIEKLLYSAYGSVPKVHNLHSFKKHVNGHLAVEWESP